MITSDYNKSHKVTKVTAKNCNLKKEYKYSTAFEALIGYLYLTKQDKRLKEILDKCLN